MLSHFSLSIFSRQEDTSGWLLTDSATSWQGTPSDRGWRYLQESLKRHDSADNDYRYAKASLETILSLGRSLSSPLWLIDILEVMPSASLSLDPPDQVYRSIILNISFESAC